MLNVEVKGDKELLLKFSANPARVHSALLRETTKQVLLLSDLIRKKLTNMVLNVRSGALRRSIFEKVEDAPTLVEGQAGSSGDVKYAGIHEFGGNIKHPGGTAYIVTAAKGAVFISNAKAEAMKAAPKRTKPHDIPMPERSYLRSSLADRKLKIIEGLHEAVGKALA